MDADDVAVAAVLEVAQRNGLCMCCWQPAVRLVLNIAPACEACAKGTCARCADADEDDGDLP